MFSYVECHRLAHYFLLRGLARLELVLAPRPRLPGITAVQDWTLTVFSTT